jgi:hypothetical protein
MSPGFFAQNMHGPITGPAIDNNMLDPVAVLSCRGLYAPANELLALKTGVMILSIGVASMRLLRSIRLADKQIKRGVHANASNFGDGRLNHWPGRARRGPLPQQPGHRGISRRRGRPRSEADAALLGPHQL